MLRLVTVFAAAVAISLAKPTNIFEIDITPEEAQKFLNSPPFTEPQLSGRTGVLPLVRYDSPNFRAAQAGPTLGHYWKNGHEIENTDDYVEEVYDASQFHGQDGLGAYNYGYRTPESAKVENRVHSGDVTGSYVYRAGDNELIKVRYWADSEGFHQEDNLPKVQLKPQEESEDVRQARLAHEKAWQEAAAAAAVQPDPQYVYKQLAKLKQMARGEYDPAKYENSGPQSQQQNYYDAHHKFGPSASAHGSYGAASAPQGQYAPAPQGQYNPAPAAHQQGSYAAASEPQGHYAPAPYNQGPALAEQGSFGAASESKGQYAPAPSQSFDAQPAPSAPAQVAAPREGKAYASSQASYQSSQFNKYGGQQQAQQGGYQQGSHQQQQHGQGTEEPEPTGPPRGFFYSFDYPVSIIVRKDAQGQNGPVNPGHPVDHDTVQQG